MSGRIKDEDVAYIRDRAPIDEVVADYVQLKNAGGGQKKGLCPFHDEKSPSFHVTPSKGYFHCFGCQTGGDVIAFLMKIDHLTFTETIERLADRIGYTLRYEESGSAPSGPSVNRSRLVAANALAATFFQEQLKSKEKLNFENLTGYVGKNTDWSLKKYGFERFLFAAILPIKRPSFKGCPGPGWMGCKPGSFSFSTSVP